MAESHFRLSITDDVAPSALLDLVVCIVFSCLALFWTGLRIISRRRSGAKFAFSDYAAFWAMFWGLFLAINSCVTVSYGGVGHHISEILVLAPGSIEPMSKTVFIGQFGWALSNTGVKLSIVHFYMMLFSINRKFVFAAYSLMASIVIYCLMVVLMAFLLCRPLAFNWDQTIPGGYCANQAAAFLASGILNLLLDILVLVLPLPVLWNLHMAMPKKLGIMFMLSLGVGICGITIWRTVIIQGLDTQDIFYDIGYLSTATNLEPLLGICVACLPTCWPLLRSTRKKCNSVVKSVFTKARSNASGNQSAIDGTRDVESIYTASTKLQGRGTFERLDDSAYPLTDSAGWAACAKGEPASSPIEIHSKAIEATESWGVLAAKKQ